MRWGLLLIPLGIAIYIVSTYNSLVQLQENVSNRWSQVENVYQRRLDLIPRLIAVVSGYAVHEKDTFLALTNLRAQIAHKEITLSKADAKTLNKYDAAQTELGRHLRHLMLVSESYPQLQANESFLQLQDQLAGTENRIVVERQRFNTAVREFNVTLQRFPQRYIAKCMGLKRLPYFSAVSSFNSSKHFLAASI